MAVLFGFCFLLQILKDEREEATVDAKSALGLSELLILLFFTIFFPYFGETFQFCVFQSLATLTHTNTKTIHSENEYEE